MGKVLKLKDLYTSHARFKRLLQALPIHSELPAVFLISNLNSPLRVTLYNQVWTIPSSLQLPWEELESRVKQPNSIIRCKGFPKDVLIMNVFHHFLIEFGVLVLHI